MNQSNNNAPLVPVNGNTKFTPAASTDTNMSNAITELHAGGMSCSSHNFSQSFPYDHGDDSNDAIGWAEAIGIDAKSKYSHNEWVTNMSPWSGGSGRHRVEKLEVQPPSGWYYKFPSAVNVSYDRPSIPEYGPEDFLPYDDNKFYNHEKIDRKKAHPEFCLPFSKYGI